MKVYTKIVFDIDDNVIEEESFEYSGSVAQCGGSGKKEARAAREQAEKGYQLQVEMFDFQKEQILKLEEGKKSEEAKKAAAVQMGLDIKREGRASTLKTVEKRPGFEVFKAKYEAEHPTEGLASEAELAKVKEEFEATEVKAAADIESRLAGAKGTGPLAHFKSKEASDIEAEAAKGIEERLAASKVAETEAAVEKKRLRDIGIKEKFDKTAPFRRRILGAAPIRRKTLRG